MSVFGDRASGFERLLLCPESCGLRTYEKDTSNFLLLQEFERQVGRMKGKEEEKNNRELKIQQLEKSFSTRVDPEDLE